MAPFEVPGPEPAEPKRVLVVDDDPGMREVLQEIVAGGGYECEAVESGLRALSILSSSAHVDLVFSDVNMPGINGIELLHTIKALLPATPVVMLSGMFETELGLQAVRGGAADYLYKPVRSSAVLEMVHRYLGPGAQVDEAFVQRSLAALTRQSGDAQIETAQILKLFESLGLKRYETLQHSRRVADYSVLLACRHGMKHPEIEDLRIGALLHDLGKVAVPHNVLMKPGPLDETEWAVMRMHPQMGADLLSPFPQLAAAAAIVNAHHERWDGNGYPLGLEGPGIPLGARIFAVIDTLDAILSDRPYRRGGTLPEARAEIRSMSGSQFDPAVFHTFQELSDLELAEIRRRYPDRDETNG